MDRIAHAVPTGPSEARRALGDPIDVRPCTRAGSIRPRDLILSARQALEVGPPMPVVGRCVDTAATRDVRANRVLVQMRKSTDDVLGGKRPPTTVDTEAPRRAEHLFMHRHPRCLSS